MSSVILKWREEVAGAAKHKVTFRCVNNTPDEFISTLEQKTIAVDIVCLVEKMWLIEKGYKPYILVIPDGTLIRMVVADENQTLDLYEKGPNEMGTDRMPQYVPMEQVLGVFGTHLKRLDRAGWVAPSRKEAWMNTAHYVDALTLGKLHPKNFNQDSCRISMKVVPGRGKRPKCHATIMVIKRDGDEESGEQYEELGEDGEELQGNNKVLQRSVTKADEEEALKSLLQLLRKDIERSP